MQYVEYGKQNRDTIILLHGGGLGPWNYREEAVLLQERYHVILPILNGHAGCDKDFVSIEDNADDIIAFIDEYCGGSVLAIGGLSLGAQILVEILSRRKDICKYAIIESALVIPMKFMQKMIRPLLEWSYFLIRQKWFAKLQFKSLKIQQGLYDDYYRDTCKIKKADMISFMEANATYSVKDALEETATHACIVVGSKEQKKMILSTKLLHGKIQNSEINVCKGLYHGELSLNHAKRYVDFLKKQCQKM